MKEFETDYIEKLIDIMKNNEPTEITLEDSNKSLIIKGNGFKPVIKEKVVGEEVQTSIQEEKEIEQQEKL